MRRSIERRLAETLTPIGGACAMEFFRPTRGFYAAMRPFEGLDVVDVGAGTGAVVDALRAEGHDAIGIDIRTDGSSRHVLTANAATFSYPPGAVGLICRPCHGPLFVAPSVERMIECDVRAVVYIGKAVNIAGDLGKYRRRFKLRAQHVGQEGEAFYLFDRRPDGGDDL